MLPYALLLFHFVVLYALLDLAFDVLGFDEVVETHIRLVFLRALSNGLRFKVSEVSCISEDLVLALNLRLLVLRSVLGPVV